MTKLTLYQLTDEYAQVMHALDHGDFDSQTIADTLDASDLPAEIEHKAQNVEIMARLAVQYVPALDAEIERLTALKEARERTAQGLRDYLKSCMERAGIKSISCPLFTISVQNNPASVEVIDPLSLHEIYWRTPEPKPPDRSPDKKMILEALKAGLEVTGAHLRQTTRLVIK